MEHGFNWFQLLPGYQSHFDHLIGALLVALLLALFSLMAYQVLRRQEVIPAKKLNAATPFELILGMLHKLMQSIIGHDCNRYLPLVATIFFFILACNLIGMIPGFAPPTGNINTNFALAIIVFAATHYFGFRASGAHYGKQFLAPIAGIGGLLLSLLFTPIELVSHLFRPVSLSIRLWGNIFADHTVLGIMENLWPPFTQILVPIPFLILGLVVACVQAFIFALLGMIYISLAIADHH